MKGKRVSKGNVSMLPDFVELKRRRARVFHEMVDEGTDAGAPLLAQLPKFQQHEGVRIVTRDVHGNVSEMNYKEKLSSKLSIKTDELAELSNAEMAKRLETVAEELSRKSMRKFFQSVNTMCEEAGTVTSGTGKPLDWRLFLETLEKIDIEFAEDGSPIFPTIVSHPDTFSPKALEQWEQDPEYRASADALIESKRMEWRDREADRKLVD